MKIDELVDNTNIIKIFYNNGIIKNIFDSVTKVNNISHTRQKRLDLFNQAKLFTNSNGDFIYDLIFKTYNLKEILSNFRGNFEKKRVYFIDKKDFIFVFSANKDTFNKALLANMNISLTVPMCKKNFKLKHKSILYTAIYNNITSMYISPLSLN